MRPWAWIFLLVVPCCALAGVQQGVQFDGKFYPYPGFDDPREAEYITTVTREVTTPHLPTAVPYHQGPTRVLFIGPRFSARPTVELCQRFDIQEQHALVARRRDLTYLPREDLFGSPGDKIEEVQQALRQGLAAQPEVVVVYDFAWNLLPAEVAQELGAMVQSGVGLVCWDLEEGNARPKDLAQFVPDAEAAARILSGVPEEVRYRFEALQAFSSPNGGGGRVVAFTVQPSQGLFSYLDDEDLYAVVGRAVLWAAGREPRTRLEVQIDAGTLRVDLRGERFPNTKVEVALYDPAAVLRHEREAAAPVRPGKAWKLPPLKAGPHWVRVTLRSGKKVVDWTTRYVHITAPVAVEAITFEPEHVAQGGTVRAKVRLSGEALEKYGLEYRLVDTYDRVIAQGRATPAPEVTIRAAVRDCLSPMCFLVAALQQDGRTIAENRAWFTVALPPVDAEDFHAMPWPTVSGGRSIWQNWLTVMQKQMGIGFDMTGGYPPSDRVWPKPIWNVRPYVYAINHGVASGAVEVNGGPARQPCLTSEEYNQEADRILTQRARDSFRFSPVCYTDCGDARLGGEGNDICFSETCIRDFQEYLKTRYGSLEELNQNWDSSYQEWSEIRPVTLAELEAWKQDPTRPKPSPGQYAHWVEHRLHMESVWAERHRRDMRVIQAVDAHARVGLDALCDYGGSFGGFDFAKMLDFMGAIGPYANSYTLQVCRSLARPGTILGSWVGGGYPHYRTPQYASATAWWLLFHRFNMQLFFCEYGGSGDLSPMFAPDLRPFPVMAEQVRQLREIQGGTGKLLLSARRENDGIAFLYSPASVHAATLTRGMPAGEFGAVSGVAGSPSVFSSDWLEYVTAHEAMARIFTDLGFQYDYVTPEQVADGRLPREGFRVLVLPYTQAFSAEVAGAIRRFAAGGGVVLADLRPGLFDGHGRLLERGHLDDLFGIERAGGFPEPLKMLPLAPVGSAPPLPEMPVDHQVHVTSATPVAQAGETPAFVHHQFGQGRAILLNCYPGRYIALRTKGVERPLLQSVKDLLAAAGIQPRVRATMGESAVPTTEIVRFTHDANEYVGMLRDHRMFYSEPVPILNQSPCQATVDFGRQAHVYDVRAGRYLGRRQQVRATLAPAQAHLYALLPYRVKAIRVAEVPSGHDLGKNFALRVVPAERHTSGAHVLHVEVTDANGRSRPEYSQNLKAPRGFTRFRLPLALSDPSGEWRLRVRDTATGVAGEERFFMEIKDPREDPQTLRNGPGAMRWRIARSEVDWLVGCSGTSQLTH